MDWIGSDQDSTDWFWADGIRMERVGIERVGMNRIKMGVLGWNGMDWEALLRIGSDWNGSEQGGLDRIGLTWIQLGKWPYGRRETRFAHKP